MAGEQSGPVAVTVATKSLSMPSASFLSTCQSATSSSTTLSSTLLSPISQPFSTLTSATFPSSVSFTPGTEPSNIDSRTFGLIQGQAPNEEYKFMNMMKNKMESSPVVADSGLRLQNFRSAWKEDELPMPGMQAKNSNVEKSLDNYIPGKNGCLVML